MQIGIDYVSLGIFIGAFLFAQIRAIPVKLRYGVLAAACGAIAIFRLRAGAQGVNLAFVAIAVGLAVFYVVKAFRAGPGPR